MYLPSVTSLLNALLHHAECNQGILHKMNTSVLQELAMSDAIYTETGHDINTLNMTYVHVTKAYMTT